MKWTDPDFLNGFDLPFVFFETTPQGRLTHGAEALADLLDYPPEQRPAHFTELDANDEEHRLQRVLQQAAGGKAVIREVIALKVGSGQRSFMLSLQPETDPEANILQLCGALYDIGLQHDLAYALEAAEERFRVLLNESSDPILTITRDGQIKSGNPAFEHVTGITGAQLSRGEKTWRDFIHEDDLARVTHAIQQKLDGRNISTVEFRMYERHREYGFYEQSLSPLHDDTGESRGLMAVMRNVTRHKERELELLHRAQQIKQRQEQVEAFNQKLKDYLLHTQAEFKDFESFLNTVCETLFSMYQPSLVFIVLQQSDRVYYRARRPLTKRFAEQHTGTLGCPLCGRVLKESAPVLMEREDQTLPPECQACLSDLDAASYLGVPLRDSSGAVHGVLAVIYEQREAAAAMDMEILAIAALQVAARRVREEQEAAHHELEHSIRQMQKMEAVGMLAGGIAHDFNNHLSSILGFSSFIQQQTDPESDLYRDISLIEQSARSASELTRQLLVFARDRDFERRAVQVDHVLQEVIKLLRRSLTRNITMETEIDPDIPQVYGDAGQINQVLMNLCINAGDAMRDEGGSLFVGLTCRPLNERERRQLLDMEDPQYVCITVKDTGPGIGPEAQKRIFDPFYTTKKNQGGTGLGLSIVYGIVRNHGGGILLESEPDCGAKFCVFLPVMKKASVKASSPDEPPGRGQNELVMVVEDEEFVRQMVTEILERSGYRVLPCSSGREALDQFETRHNEIDIVFLDLIMPKMDGGQVFRQLQAIDPNVTVLLTSGYARLGQAEALLEAGACGLVHKPYVTNTLLSALRKALKSKSQADA